MTVAIGSIQANGQIAGNTPTVTATSCVVGEQLVVFFAGEGSGAETFTDNQSGTWTRLQHTTTWFGGGADAGVYVRDQLVSTTSNHVITGSGANGGAMSTVVVHLQGQIGTGSACVLNSGIGQTSGGAPTVSLSGTTDAKSFLLGILINSSNTTNQVTPPSGWTEDTEAVLASPAMTYEVAHLASGATVSSVAWVATNGFPVAVVLEISAYHQASSNVTLGAATVSGAATTRLHAQSSVSLGALTSTATANHGNRNLSLNATLGSVVGIGHQVSLSQTLGAVVPYATCFRQNRYTFPSQRPPTENAALGENDLDVS